MLKKLKVQTALIIPLQTILNFLLLAPTVIIVYLSVVDWTPLSGVWWEAPFAGAKNFIGLFAFDTRFHFAVGRTLGIVAISVILEFLIGLSLALLLFNVTRGKKIAFSILVLPMMIAPVIVGYDFYLLFQIDGPINQMLSLVSNSPIHIDWLKHTGPATFAIIVAETWQWTPFMFLIIYSGLVTLPDGPFNAARVMGASEWQIFRMITLPLLKPIIYIAFLIRSLECLKLFDAPYVMTGGGPVFTTETISIYMYLAGFKYWKISYIAAGALALLLIIAFISRRAAKPLLTIEKK